MPNAQPIAIKKNGTDTVTFSPDSVSGTHVQYQDLSEDKLTLRKLFHFDRPVRAKDVRRSLRINLPVNVTLQSGEVVTRLVSMKVELVSAADVPKVSRTEIRTLAANALVDPAVIAVFDNPEWVW